MHNVSLVQVSQHFISFNDIKSGLFSWINNKNSFILFLIELQFQWMTFMPSVMFIVWELLSCIVGVSLAVSMKFHELDLLNVEVFVLAISISNTDHTVSASVFKLTVLLVLFSTSSSAIVLSGFIKMFLYSPVLLSCLDAFLSSSYVHIYCHI